MLCPVLLRRLIVLPVVYELAVRLWLPGDIFYVDADVASMVITLLFEKRSFLVCGLFRFFISGFFKSSNEASAVDIAVLKLSCSFPIILRTF